MQIPVADMFYANRRLQETSNEARHGIGYFAASRKALVTSSCRLAMIEAAAAVAVGRGART